MKIFKFRHNGFTLIEMLVASFIFTLLGIGLVSLMRQGNNIWQEQESSKNSYSKTVNVLTQIQRDLQNIITDPQNNGRLVIGRDPLGRQFFVFNKFIKPDNHNPILKYSGITGNFVDQNDTHWGPLTETETNSADVYYFYPHGPRTNLLPSQGKMEVAYFFSPNPRATIKLVNGQELTGEIASFGDNAISFKVMHQGIMRLTEPIDTANIVHQKLLGYELYRGFVSPIGADRTDAYPGSGSLFSDFMRDAGTNVPVCQQWMRDLRPSLNASEDAGAYDSDILGFWLEDFINEFNLKYESFTSNVVYVGLQAWFDGDNFRDAGWYPSTFEENLNNEQPTAIFLDTNTQGFPKSLLLTVTAISTQGSLTVGRLSSPITKTSMTINIEGGGMMQGENSGFPFALIGNEWVYYPEIDGKTLNECIRGVRNTFPTAHPAGTPVYWGRTLQKVIQLSH